jgi:hypothetical protein
MATNKRELLENATHWLGQAKRNGLKRYGIGAIFIFFDMTESGSAVATANVDKAALVRELKTILRKVEERVIIDPREAN